MQNLDQGVIRGTIILEMCIVQIDYAPKFSQELLL